MSGSLKRLVSRLTRGQGGFTLIEMIVVVGIIAVLAAVIVPNIGKFVGSGESGAKDAEFDSLETAMSAMMADNAVNLVTANAVTASNSWSTLPVGAADVVVLYGASASLRYLAAQSTVYFYCYDVDGLLTAQHETAVAC